MFESLQRHMRYNITQLKQQNLIKTNKHISTKQTAKFRAKTERVIKRESNQLSSQKLISMSII